MNVFTRRVELPSWVVLLVAVQGALFALSLNVAIGRAWSPIAILGFVLCTIAIGRYRRTVRQARASGPLNI